MDFCSSCRDFTGARSNLPKVGLSDFRGTFLRFFFRKMDEIEGMKQDKGKKSEEFQW